MPQQDNNSEVVTLKLPSGEKKLRVPKGLSPEGIKKLVQTKHPELMEAPKQQAQPPQPPQASAGAGPQPSIGSRFTTGMGHGINPFHSAPEGTPSTGSTIKDMGADMLNLRESNELGKSGNRAGQLGLLAGTAASFAGPELAKGLGESMKGAETAVSEASKSGAAKRAASLVRQLRGNIKDANLATTLTQPIKEQLDRMFEQHHAALEKHIVPLTNSAQQAIRRIAELEPDMAKEVGDLFRKSTAKNPNTLAPVKMVTRTALDYREADKLVSRLRQMSDASPSVRRLADEVSSSIDAIVKAEGKLDERKFLKNAYKEMQDITNAAHRSVTKSAIRALAKETPYLGKFVGTGEGKVGQEEIKAANDLMERLQGRAKQAVMKKIGEVTKQASRAWQTIPPAYRSMMAAFGTDDRSPEQQKMDLEWDKIQQSQ